MPQTPRSPSINSTGLCPPAFSSCSTDTALSPLGPRSRKCLTFLKLPLPREQPPLLLQPFPRHDHDLHLSAPRPRLHSCLDVPVAAPRRRSANTAEPAVAAAAHSCPSPPSPDERDIPRRTRCPWASSSPDDPAFLPWLPRLRHGAAAALLHERQITISNIEEH